MGTDRKRCRIWIFSERNWIDENQTGGVWVRSCAPWKIERYSYSREGKSKKRKGNDNKLERKRNYWFGEGKKLIELVDSRGQLKIKWKDSRN